MIAIIWTLLALQTPAAPPLLTFDRLEADSTLVLKDGSVEVRVRLAGVDTLSWSKEPREAACAAQNHEAIVQFAKAGPLWLLMDIEAEATAKGLTVHLGHLFSKRVPDSLNVILLRSGCARMTSQVGSRYQSILQAAWQAAQGAQRGLYAQTHNPDAKPAAPPTGPAPSRYLGIHRMGFDALEDGMTVRDVYDILGNEGQETSRSRTGNLEIVEIVWRASGDRSIHCSFHNGRLYSRIQFGLS